MNSEAVGSGRWSRWRWRMRGAWQWPAFAAFVIVDGVLFDRLPASGNGGDLAGGLLLSGFLNLLVVALLAPAAGRLLRLRRPDLPRVVANDYAGTILIVGAACAVAGLGVAHRPSVLAHARAFQTQSDAVRAYVLVHGDAVQRHDLNRADSLRLDDNYFRTCVPGRDPARALCLFVDTSKSPPVLHVDPNPIPNDRYFGPRGLGRSG
jgi:hypothetical protein